MISWIIGGTVTTALLFAGATGAAGIDLPQATGAHPPGMREFTSPVDGFTVTQRFGCTPFLFEPSNPSCPSGHWHSGLDLAAPAGGPVRATLAGIATVTSSTQGYGLHIVIDHGGGLSSLYGHLSMADVLSGTPVEAGAVIGRIGSTGNSTGPHLHFEIRRDNLPEDPAIDISLP
ncbi:MAG: M23 family metallopeptidase [Candidatus Dormibacteria bacterium]